MSTLFFPPNPNEGDTFTGENGVVYTYVNGNYPNGIWQGANGNLLNVTTDVIPSSNISQSLGNATNQWQDLWVSGNTIYIGSVPLTIDNGTLQVDGANVVTGNGGGGNTGDITFTNANISTIITEPIQIQPLHSVLAGTNGPNLYLQAGDYAYTNSQVLAEGGALHLQGGNASIFQYGAGTAVGNVGGAGGPVVITSTSLNSFNGTRILNNWVFDNTGTLTLPNPVQGYANATIKAAGTSIAIGYNVGSVGQQGGAVAIGYQAGNSNQNVDAIAIGVDAGSRSQGVRAVAIGTAAGVETQGESAVAIGLYAGSQYQGANAVAIGVDAGTYNQNASAVAIGREAGVGTQGNNAVALGYYAGRIGQGGNAIAIGALAGLSAQGNNTIILNATGVAVNGVYSQTDSFYVAPVRNDTGNTTNALYYNTATFEISYGPAGGSSAAAGNAGDIQINVAGNIGADSTLRYVDNGGEMTLYADYLNAPGIFTSDIYAGDGTPSNITLTTSYGNATWTFDTTGNLSIPGALNHYVVDNLANLAINSWTPIQLTTGDGVNTGYQNWTFDNAGLLTLPGGGTITSALGVPQEGLWLGYNGHRLLLNSDGQFWTGGIELGGNALPGYVGSYGNITLNANIGTGPLEKQWVFGADGNLTAPGNINFTNNAAIQLNPVTGVTIYGNSVDQATALNLNNVGDAALYANANVTINSNSQGSNPQWIFGSDGTTTFPGNLAGNGASPAPSINGFDSIKAINFSASGNVTASNFITGGAGGNITGANVISANSFVTPNTTINGGISTTGSVVALNIIQSGIGNINGYNGYFANNLTAQGTVQATSFVAPDGNGTFIGNVETGIDALYAGLPGFTVLGSNVVTQFAANVNSYAQVNLQNLNTGDSASGDYIITADIGNNSAYYLDLGLASSTHNDPYFFGDVSTANDGYLTVVGPDSAGPSTSAGPGNLILGSSNGLIKMFVGIAAQANVVQQVTSTGIEIFGNVSATGNIIAGNITTTGSTGNITGANVISAVTLSASGSANLYAVNMSQSIAWPDASQIYVDSGIIVQGNIGALITSPGTTQITAGSNNWLFDNTGNLSIPGGGAVWNIGTGTAGLTANILDPQTVNLGLDYSSKTATLAGNSGVTIATNLGITQWNFYGNATMLAPGDITTSGDVTGASFNTAGAGGDLVMSNGNITGANVVTATTFTGNIYPQSGATLYVDGNRTDTYTANGTINFPYKTVQSALNAAAANTTINVAPGIYSENLVMPDLNGICIAGSSEMNTTISNATTGHTFSWIPAGSVGNTISKFCLQNIELVNTDATGTYHTLHIDATNVVYPDTFIAEEFDINTVDFEGNQTQANTTVYLNNVGAQNVYHSQILGGALTVINPGQFRSTSMVIGNSGDPHDFNVTYDGNLPRNGLGRNDITIAAGTAVFGNVTLNGHPIYQEDVDSVVVGNLNGANLSTFYASGRDYSPTILAYGQHGVVGGVGGSITLTFPDPNTSGTSFNFVDFSNGHILGKVSLTKANLLPLSARGYAVVQGQAQFDTTAANGISANGYVALDIRGANFNQSVLQATGAATIDRSVVTLTSRTATTLGNVINIAPPLAAGATYTTAVTPNSNSTVWVTSKNTGNLTVTASANTTVDITVTRNT